MRTVNTSEIPTVLVIDDDPQIVSLCRRSLERSGSTVPTACGLAYVKKAATQSRQVVLLIMNVLLKPPAFRLWSQKVEKGANGLDAIPPLQRSFHAALPLIISAYTKDELIAEAITQVIRPFFRSRLIPRSYVGPSTRFCPASQDQDGESAEISDDVWVD